jgi:ABC-2 type transport system permease protein
VAEYLEIPALYYLTPLKYFDVYAVAREGINIVFLLLAAVIVAISIAVARRKWAGREM